MNSTGLMKRGSRLAWLVAMTLMITVAGDLSAQEVTAPPAGTTAAGRTPLLPAQSSDRTEGREFSFLIREFTAPDLEVKQIYVPGYGTYDGVLHIKNTATYGIAFGYSLSEHLNINLDLSYGKSDFTADWGPYVITGKGELLTSNLNIDYNLLKRRFTPFVSGGIGYMHYNTNVPSDETTWYGWWDEWWGVGGVYGSTPTHHTSAFTWNAAAGVRWDVNSGWFLKASYQVLWSKVGGSGTYRFPQYMLSAGWRW